MKLRNQCLNTALAQCRSMKQLQQIHAQIVCSQLCSNAATVTRLVLFSATSDNTDLNYTHQLFDTISSPTTFVWNTIIRACSRGKNPNRAITHFIHMLRAGVRPDHRTFPFLAKSSSRLNSISMGVSIHCFAFKSGTGPDRFVANSLIHMYATCGEIIFARKLFDGMPSRNLVSWNSMVDGYAKCGDMISAHKLFKEMPNRDIVSWSALIDGHVKSMSEYDKALALFDRMQIEGPKANSVTMISVLSACAHLGALDRGREMHRYILDNRLEMNNLALATSTMDMYAKCGAIEEALQVFYSTPVSSTDVLFWNSMIGGLATHGFCQKALDIFIQMPSSGILPDEITYLNLLTGCAHSGRVADAKALFKSLEDDPRVSAHIEHYACMVDVLGRSGRVEEAFEFANSIPMQPTPSVLGALLSACHTHGRPDLGETIAKKLVELEPNADGRHVGLSNVYASAKRWREARTARKVMEERGVKKLAGCSSVEVQGVLHGFTAGNRLLHLRSNEIYSMLTLISVQMHKERELKHVAVGSSSLDIFMA